MPPPSRRALWSSAAPAAASLAIILSAPAQYLGRQQDDLLYIIGSQALAGGGYRLFTSPGAPPLTMINPGFPLLLLPVTWAFGGSLVSYQVFCLLILAAAPWALWLWLRPRLGEAKTALVCLLFGSSPVVLSQAGTVMSEGSFLLLTVGLLFALEAPGRGALPAVLLLAISQLRTAGLALAFGALARPLRERRWARAAWTAAPAALGMILWSAWSSSVSEGTHKLELLRLVYDLEPLRHLCLVAADNAGYYLSGLGSSFLPARWGDGAVSIAAGSALLGMSARGCRRLLKEDSCAPVVWILAGTAAMHLAWPWHYDRYLIMPLPLLLWTAARGLGRAAVPVLAVLLCAQVCFQSRVWLGAETSWSKPEIPETYAWLKARATPADVLVSKAEVRDGFYTAMPSLPLPPAEDAAGFASLLKKHRVRFVLWEDGLDNGLSAQETAGIQRELDLDSRLLKDRAFFKLVHENPGERASVYEVR